MDEVGAIFCHFEGLEKTVVLKAFTDHGNAFKFLYLLRDLNYFYVLNFIAKPAGKNIEEFATLNSDLHELKNK
jgi:hypothetical protein